MNAGSHSCSEMEHHLPLHAGGDLEPEVARAVTEHLAGCASCATRHAAALASRDALRTGLARGIGPAPDLWIGVRARLEREGHVAHRAPKRAAARTAWFGWSVAAAAAAVLGFWLGGVWTRDTLQPLTVSPGVAEIAEVVPVQVPAVMPVSTGGLRRLAPGESRMRDRAQYYVDVPWDGLPFTGGNQPYNTTASLGQGR